MRRRSAIAIRWGTVLACLFALPFLTWVPMAILRLVTSIVPNPEGALNTLLLGLYAPVFFASLLLSLTARYLFFSAAGLALSLITLGLLVARDRRQVFRRACFYLLVACAASVLVFPIVFRYRPAVQASPGVEMRLVDQPGFLNGAVRSCQISAELQNEVYVPVGWAAEHMLVYRRYSCGPQAFKWDCGDETTWAYDVQTGHTTLHSANEAALTGHFCAPQICVKPYLSTKSFFSGRRSPEALVSTDGRWIAFTARHVYGPEDLLVISGN